MLFYFWMTINLLILDVMAVPLGVFHLWASTGEKHDYFSIASNTFVQAVSSTALTMNLTEIIAIYAGFFIFFMTFIANDAIPAI